MLESLNQIVGFLFHTFDSVIGLYLAGGVLTGVFALWLLRKVVRLFDRLSLWKEVICKLLLQWGRCCRLSARS